MSSRDELAEEIDRACKGAASFVEVASRLEVRAREVDSDESGEPQLAAFVAAFRYDLAIRTDPRRTEYGPFVPMIETEEYTFPPRLADVPDQLKAQWEDVVPTLVEPAARARLCDLLWVTHHGSAPHERAREAAVAYGDAATTWADLSAALALLRALELSLEINDTAMTDALSAAIVSAARAALDESDQKPGVSLRLIQALVRMPDAPAEVDQLLEQARVRYRKDIWVADSITDLQVIRVGGDSSRADELRREQLADWRDAADAETDGLVSLTYLQHGLELARTHGMRDEAQAFLAALQNFDRASIDFKPFEVEAKVDTAELESLLHSLVEEDWPSSLRAFGATGPPSGDAERNEEIVRKLMKEHPVAFLFPKTVLGPENTLIRTVVGEHAQFAAELAQYEARGIMFWGQLATEALRRIQVRHGWPAKEALLPFFSAPLIPPECADAFARGVSLYGEGRYDESALVVLPRIEAVIRDMARGVGLIVIREPQGVRPGGVRPLGMVLAALAGTLDESWRRYLWSTLVEPLGLNLRNRLAHGLSGGNALSAALLLHIACFLALLKAPGPHST